MKHHAEAFIEKGCYGWQCLACGGEATNLPSFLEAEQGRDAHEQESVAADHCHDACPFLACPTCPFQPKEPA